MDSIGEFALWLFGALTFLAACWVLVCIIDPCGDIEDVLGPTDEPEEW